MTAALSLLLSRATNSERAEQSSADPIRVGARVTKFENRPMATIVLDTAPASVARRPLTEADAIDIWISRWLKIRRKDILARYGCDPRRIYEIWEGAKFPASRQRALAIFSERYPSLTDRIDFGRHKRLPLRSSDPNQLALFD